ncbi:MAG: Omp28-related outer membrane protein, partial [Ignavibacteria bacterium]
KLFLFLFAVFTITALTFSPSYSQGNNVLLEACTGTWCGFCPCGHVIIDGILVNYPNTLVLEYHGPANGSDPFSYFNGNQILGMMGFNSYPSGVIGRRTGILSRSAWNNQVVLQTNTMQPGVSITWNKSYNSSTRQLTATINVTALQNLSGNYYINYVILESNLIYYQSGYTEYGCYGGSNYVHKHVVRDMVNGPTGELLNSGGTWNQGQTITRNLNYTVNNSWNASNSELGVFVYKQGNSLSTDSYVQQTKKEPVTGGTGISNENEIPRVYSLSQNYPNPFNPTTNIKFSLPKDGNASLKVYDMLGNEVASFVDGFLKAGVYNAEFDGANFSSGVYLYKLVSKDFVDTKKMILIK